MNYKSKECACGCGRVGRFHTYASNACKQRAYRNRIKKADRLRAFSVDACLRADLKEAKADAIIRLLHTVRGTRQRRAVDRAVQAIVSGYREKLADQKMRGKGRDLALRSG